MKIFRITLSKWVQKLVASGYPGRWNSKGVFMIYSSGSRALASLENLVHRSGEGLNNTFSTIVMEIPNDLEIEQIEMKNLPNDWFEYENYTVCQKIGDNWIENGKSCILRVPSAIIKMEFNYLINPNHKDFNKIKILNIEKFEFDPRLKS